MNFKVCIPASIAGLAALLLSSTVASAETMLVVRTVNGASQVMSLAEKPCITIDDNQLVVTGSDATFSYPVQSVDKFHYVDSSSLREIVNSNDAPDLKVEDDYLIFLPADFEQNVAVYDTEGRMIVSRTIQAKASERISIGSWNAGVYLVTVNGFTTKIVKR